jgi:hypothetical protein
MDTEILDFSQMLSQLQKRLQYAIAFKMKIGTDRYERNKAGGTASRAPGVTAGGREAANGCSDETDP